MKDGLSHPKLEAMAKMYKMDDCSNVEVGMRMDQGDAENRDDNIMMIGDHYHDDDGVLGGVQLDLPGTQSTFFYLKPFDTLGIRWSSSGLDWGLPPSGRRLLSQPCVLPLSRCVDRIP